MPLFLRRLSPHHVLSHLHGRCPSTEVCRLLLLLLLLPHQPLLITISGVQRGGVAAGADQHPEAIGRDGVITDPAALAGREWCLLLLSLALAPHELHLRLVGAHVGRIADMSEARPRLRTLRRLKPRRNSVGRRNHNVVSATLIAVADSIDNNKHKGFLSSASDGLLTASPASSARGSHQNTIPVY